MRIYLGIESVNEIKIVGIVVLALFIVTFIFVLCCVAGIADEREE